MKLLLYSIFENKNRAPGESVLDSLNLHNKNEKTWFLFYESTTTRKKNFKQMSQAQRSGMYIVGFYKFIGFVFLFFCFFISFDIKNINSRCLKHRKIWLKLVSSFGRRGLVRLFIDILIIIIFK